MPGGGGAPSSSGWTMKKWSKSLSCRTQGDEQVHSPTPMLRNSPSSSASLKPPSLSGCSRSVLKSVIHGNTKVAHKSASCSPQTESERFNVDFGPPPPVKSGAAKQPLPPSLPRRVPGPRLGGCHGCHVADEAFIFRTSDGGPYASRLQRASAICHLCGTVFATSDALEHHNATKHAVTQVLRQEYQYAVVEKIWERNGAPGRIDRIIRLNSRDRMIQYREYQKHVQEREKAKQRLGRCSADGDEQMWFYAAPVTCDLGAYGSSSICSSSLCVCKIIRSGLQFLQQRRRYQGIRLASTCTRAHQIATSSSDQQHRHYAMLVCKVIAGKTYNGEHGDELPSGFDSVLAGDLYVFIPRAVLPEFVIIYKW